MERQANTALELAKAFGRAYFEQRDPEQALSLLTDDIEWFGTGAFEHVRGRAEARRYFEEELAQDPAPYALHWRECSELPVGAGGAVVFAALTVSNPALSLDCRLSMAARREDGRLKICALHMSVPTSLQDDGEYFPADLPERRLAEIKESLMDTAIAGGMMGGYIAPRFPFYFINKRMLDYLGYGSEAEFVRDIGGYISNCMHPDDREAVDRAVERQLERDGGYEVEYRMRKRDGSYIWVHDIGRRVTAEDGRDAITSVCYDITDQRRALEAQRLSSLRLQTAVDHAGLGYWEYDIPGRTARFLPGSAQLLGVPEVLTDFPNCLLEQKFVLPPSEGDYLDLYRELDAGAAAVSRDIHMRRGGEPFWGRIQYTTVPDEAGRPKLAIGTCLDITAQVAAETRYEEALAYNQLAIRDALSYFRLNLTEDRVEEGQFDPSLPRDYRQYTVDGLFEALRERVRGAEYRREHARMFCRSGLLARFAEGASSGTLDIPFDHGNGVVWTRLQINMVQNPRTGCVIALTYAVDRTESKAAGSLLASIAASDYDYLMSIDPDRGTYLRFDADGGRRTGQYAQWIHDTLTDVHPNDRRRAAGLMDAAHVRAVLEEERSFVVFLRAVQGDGAVARKKLTYRYVDEGRQELALTCADITDLFDAQQRKNEALAAALTAARQADAAKSEFLSRMSHEIRTPMNSVLGMTAIAKESLDDRAAVDECLSKIELSSRFMLSLINDILDMSRIESGKLTLEPAPFSVGGLLDAVRTIGGGQAEAKGLRFACRTGPGLGGWYVGDAMKLQQILLNLVSNAVKFTPAGGSVTLTADGGGGALRFRVEDTGCGISPDFLPRLFEPFSQEHGGTTTVYGGTGLGLAISRNLAALMGGGIEVDSAPGRGSVFTVSVPLKPCAPPEPADAPAPEVPACSFAGRRLLLAEDHPLNVEVARRLLERRGFAVEHAANGRLALERFRESPLGYFDAVLMDVRMPVMDGLEAARAIRSLDRPDARTVPIVAMTANAFEEDRQQSRQAGMNAHLAKPIDPPALFETLKKLLSPA